jgi:hypothetical protein
VTKWNPQQLNVMLSGVIVMWKKIFVNTSKAMSKSHQLYQAFLSEDSILQL